MSKQPVELTRHCLALDLKDNDELIAQYKEHHQADKIWPEITDSIRSAGIHEMDIYCIGNRLFMVMAVSQQFSFLKKSQADQNNAMVQQWETLMSTFQQALPWAKTDEKWLLMENIYSL